MLSLSRARTHASANAAPAVEPPKAARAAVPAPTEEEDVDSDEEEGSPASAPEEEEDEDDSFEASVLREAVAARDMAARASALAQQRAPSSEWSAPTERARWSKVKKQLRPTQAALVRRARARARTRCARPRREPRD
jgi:hypothetical protein